MSEYKIECMNCKKRYAKEELEWVYKGKLNNYWKVYIPYCRVCYKEEILNENRKYDERGTNFFD